MTELSYPANGARVLIRDEEWLVTQRTPSKVGGYELTCRGISETVRDVEAIFLSSLEKVEILDPAKTVFTYDESPAFLQTRLSIEARLRHAPAAGEKLTLGHRAAMDPLPFQLVPTTNVLKMLRPRYLIADSTGLGKTLEAGILTAELARRGRARRILVVSTKAMMTQFQQEFWNRFTIPLKRLDSNGIRQIRKEIPTSHNPFNYYDRTIISMDTLKRDGDYRNFLESAWWDLIIIDEAHNVSLKGSGTRSQNFRLAELLATRSDALILLTATPHSGKSDSFASLIRMLDPTALAPGESLEAKKDELSHLFIRRFRKDVAQDLKDAGLKPRLVKNFRTDANLKEEKVFRLLEELKLDIDAETQSKNQAKLSASGEVRSLPDMLLKTTLIKSFLSSPQACLQTLNNRLKSNKSSLEDRTKLEALKEAVEDIGLAEFSKFQSLLKALKDPRDPTWSWSGKDPKDRLIIFTERLETLRLLKEELPEPLGLKASQVAVLSGSDPDHVIADVVERFGQERSELRLLLATDVASEGLNLHYYSHRLLHFDLPWALMVYQQRNGRIDRYGQTETPQIGYFSTRTTSRLSDVRVLEVLNQKAETLFLELGDETGGLFDPIDEAELRTESVARAIEATVAQAAPSQPTEDDSFDFDALLDGVFDDLTSTTSLGSALPQHALETTSDIQPPPVSLFQSDADYVEKAVHFFAARKETYIQKVSAPSASTITFQPGKHLQHWLKRTLDDEMYAHDNQFALNPDRTRILNDMAQARASKDGKTQLQYLWPLHPFVQWLDLQLMSYLRRQQAPLMRAPRGVGPDEALFVIQAQFPNRRGQTMLSHCFGILVSQSGEVRATLSLEEWLKRTGLLGTQNTPIPNTGHAPEGLTWLNASLVKAIAAAKDAALPMLRAFNTENRPKLDQALAALRERHQSYGDALKEHYAKGIESTRTKDKERDLQKADRMFEAYSDWATQTLELDSVPQLLVVAALVA